MINNKTNKEKETTKEGTTMTANNRSIRQICKIIPFVHGTNLHETRRNIIEKSERYLKDHIYPALHCPPESEEWQDIEDFAEGSILAYSQEFMGFTVIEHYRRYGNDYLVIARNGEEIHCFILYSDYARNLARYASYDIDSSFKRCRKSRFIGKTVRDIVSEYDIPSVDEIPYVV